MSVGKVRKRKNGFGIVTEEVMQNTAMSSDARFLIALVSTLPPDWKFHIWWLKEKTGWGRQKLQKVMKELEDNYHLIRTRLAPSIEKEDAEERGGFSWDYEFLLEPENQPIETKAQGVENQSIENQSIESQSIENHAKNKRNRSKRNTSTNNTPEREKAPPAPRLAREGETNQPPEKELSPPLDENAQALQVAVAEVCGITAESPAKDREKLDRATRHVVALRLSVEDVYAFREFWRRGQAKRSSPLPLSIDYFLSDSGPWSQTVRPAHSKDPKPKDFGPESRGASRLAALGIRDCLSP